MTTQDTRDIAGRAKLAIAQDTFSRANQSGWSPASDGETWSQIQGSGTTAISGNEGTFTNASALNLFYLGTQTVKDAGGRVRFSVSGTGDGVGMILRADSTGQNFYHARYRGGTFFITKLVSGTSSDITSTAFTVTASSFYWIRYRIVGTTHYAKIWADGTGEPAVWTLSGTDSSITSSGRFGLSFFPNNVGHTDSVDSFAVVDAWPNQNRDIASRFALAATTTRDLTTRLKAAASTLKDVASRARLLAVTSKDVAARLALLANQSRDLAGRFLLGIPHDVAARLPLIAGTLKDWTARLFVTAQPLRDVAMRLHMPPVDTWDIAARLFLHAPTTAVPPGATQVNADSSPNLAPYGGTQDLTVFKMQMVLVFKSDGVTFLDCWRDAPLLSGFKESVSAAISPLKVQLPRPWNAFDLVGQPGSRGTVAQGNVVQYWLYGPNLPTTGLLRYQGVIDTWEPAITDKGEESVVVTIVPQSSAIADRGIGGSVSFGTVGQSSTYVDPVVQFKYWFTTTDPVTGVPYLSPLSFDTAGSASSSGVATQYTYTNQQIKSIFDTLLLMLPANWFYRPNPDDGSSQHKPSVTLNVPPVTAQHTLVVGQHVSNPTYKEDWMPVKNEIYFTGYTPPGATGPIVATSVSGDIATLGARIQLQNDSRVQDQNTLQILADGLLTALDQPAVRATVRVVDYRGDSMGGLGYDIETLKVGDSCVVIDATSTTYGMDSSLWDVAQWDVDVWDYSSGNPINQIVTIVGLTYGFDYVDLELATLQPSQDRNILKIQQQLQDFTVV